MADTVLPRYKVDASGDLVPDLRAAAAIIYNPATNEVLWEENSQRPALDRQHHEGDDGDRVPREQSRSDRRSSPSRAATSYRASTTHLRLNDKVTAGDLLHLLLIAVRQRRRPGARARVAARARTGSSSG